MRQSNSSGARRRVDSRDQAQDHWPVVHRDLRAEAKKIGGAQFLAQARSIPTWIESVSFFRWTLGRHQIAPQCRRSAGAHEHAMVEPLRELFRTRCGRSAESLAAQKFVGRHPFPGPASPSAAGRRVAGKARYPPQGRRDLSRRRSARPGSTTRSGRRSRVLLPVQTVGVMGDGRTYEFVCALRAVTSVDGMTADFYPFDMGSSVTSRPASSTKCAASTGRLRHHSKPPEPSSGSEWAITRFRVATLPNL